MKRLADARELIDGPLDERLLAGNLRDLRRLNGWLGGVGVSWRALEPLLAASPLTRLLDLGTGSADIPQGLLRRASHRYPLEVVATDVRPEIVALARVRAARAPHFEVRLGLPARIDSDDGSFDVVHASMVLHHLDPSAALALLREMARVAAGAVIINDLDRQVTWYRWARLLTGLATRNAYTRHDAPLSVRRAYRPGELVELAQAAGLAEHARHWTRPAYRYAIVLVHA